MEERAEKGRKPHYLKWQLIGIVLVCWLVPVALVLGVMSWYVVTGLGQRTQESLTEQLSVNTRLCADRLDSAIAASRTASTNSAIKDAWAEYRENGRWPNLYRRTQSFLDSQYWDDHRFLFATFYFNEDPAVMRTATFYQAMGQRYAQVNSFWKGAFPATRALADTLDTGIGFLEYGGELYLVRNVVSSSFEPIGTLVLCLNQDYYFGNLTVMQWCTDVTLFLDDAALPLSGTVQPPPGELGRTGLDLGGRGDNYLASGASDREYSLDVVAKLDTEALTAQYSGYRSILAVMLVLLIPLLTYALIFFQRKVTRPVRSLMEGAGKIEAGELGYQVDYRPNSREFQYLTDSFNHMSGRLSSQFEHIYQEELALRDARIKALQSHINPHFLNNTLEIINWEARMSGDAKVSKMIEALSTVLDAAVARDKRPEVRLAEEMNYVSAYLYIITERFGKRLDVAVDIPEELMECMVPRLILQPVIENAVEHGIGPGGYGKIRLTGRREGGLLLLDTENDGGLSDEDEAHIRELLAPDCDAAGEPSGNIGISNVNQRLRILYGPPSGLRITRGEGTRVVARITIALKEESGDGGQRP